MIKIEWDSRNNEFYVKIGSGGNRRMVAKTSQQIARKLDDAGVSPNLWKWTRAAKKQIEKEKNG